MQEVSGTAAPHWSFATILATEKHRQQINVHQSCPTVRSYSLLGTAPCWQLQTL